LALRQRREIRFKLDIEKHLYSLSDKPKIYRLPESIELKLFTADSEVIDKGKGSVRFFPDGSSTGGRVTLVAGERKRLLDINWLTGAVIIKDTDSG
jgi:general secretion pathway protein H